MFSCSESEQKQLNTWVSFRSAATAPLHNGVVRTDLLPGIAAFAQVAKYGSFTKVAVIMGISPSALSQTLRTLEIHCDNTLLDLVADGFDAGLRIGEYLAQDVVALPMGGIRLIATVAAPSYLQGREPSQHS